MTLLELQHIGVSFGQETVLTDLSLQLKERETLAVLGRSGCGKTTLLKVIAGLINPSVGQILLRKRSMMSLPPQQRGMIYLYQEALLFPHLNVFENVSFGLRLRKESPANVRKRTMDMLEKLDLSAQLDKMPDTLSGGQKQRVAFGRALILHPEVLLLDEPFGNLDVETRQNMQQFFKKVAAEEKISAIFVTHDLKEALLMGDRLAFLSEGQIEVFPNREAFIQDSRTGVKGELEFWKNLNLE